MNKTEAVEVLQDYLNEIRGFIAFEVDYTTFRLR